MLSPNMAPPRSERTEHGRHFRRQLNAPPDPPCETRVVDDDDPDAERLRRLARGAARRSQRRMRPELDSSREILRV